MPSRHAGSIASTILLAVVCLALLLQAGCAPKLPPLPPWEKDAGALLDQADSQIKSKLYDLASKTIDTFFHKYPTSTQRDRALYLSGEIRFMLRDYRKALSYYKELIERYPASAYIATSKYRLGQCYFELKEYDPAIANLADRRKITDPAQQRRIAEMLATAYGAKKNYSQAVKELARRWYPRAYFNSPAKTGNHRALADIQESIEELRYYRAAVFVPPPGPDSDTAKALAAEHGGTLTGAGDPGPSTP